MKIVNFMNFVRQYEPRAKDLEAAESRLFETTQKELFLAKEYGLENTFLLQYDVLLDEKYVNLFKTEADAHMELGLWYEIVKPLVEKMEQSGEAYRILILPDHPTPIVKRTHTNEPIPYLLYDSTKVLGQHEMYSEKAGEASGILKKDGYRLMDYLLND